MIIRVQGSDLRELQAGFSNEDIYSFRVGIDGTDLKVKFNGGMWSPPIGQVEVADRPHTCPGAGEDTFDLHTLHSLPVEAIDRIIQVATFVRSQKESQS